MKTTAFIGVAERQLHELASRMVAYNGAIRSVYNI